MNKKIFRLLDSLGVIVLLASVLFSIMSSQMMMSATAIWLLYFGFIFVYSNRIKNYSKIAAGLHWASQYVARPRTEYNHIVWGGLMIFLGISSLVSSIQGNYYQAKEFYPVWHVLIKDPFFWLSIVIIIGFNVLFAIDKHDKSVLKSKD